MDTKNITLTAIATYNDVSSQPVYITLVYDAIPIFGTYNASMRESDSQTLTANVTIGGNEIPAEITISGINADNWLWNSTDRKLTYSKMGIADITLTVTATYNDVTSQTIYITLIHEAYTPLPVTDKFFTFDESGQIITGFATNFLESCTGEPSLENYLMLNGARSNANVLDLTGKYISGGLSALSSARDAALYSQISLFYSRVKIIILDNATFNWNKTDNGMYSGYCTFGSLNSSAQLEDFHTLEQISMKNTNFAPTIVAGDTNNVSVYSANRLFANQNFHSLTSINMDGAVFATSDMINSAPASGVSTSISTAASTFSGCNFPKLANLQIKNCVFAADEMCQVDPAVKTNVSTANLTFASCKFSMLKSLSLNSNIYAAEKICYGDIATAAGTFASSSFNTLDELDLDKETYVVDGMLPDDSEGLLSTAQITFAYCQMPSLLTLRLDTTTFAKDGITKNAVQWAYCTFNHSNTPILESLYLPTGDYQPNDATFTWNQTFDGVRTEDDGDGITIYGYDSYESCKFFNGEVWFQLADWETSDFNTI